MRAQMDVMGTGTFGKLGSVADIEEIKLDNQALRSEVRQLRDQLKQVMQTVGNFQIFVQDKLARIEQENRELKHRMQEMHAL